MFAEIRRRRPRFTADQVREIVVGSSSDNDSEDEREDFPAPVEVSTSSDGTCNGSQSPGRQTVRTVRSSTTSRKCPSPPSDVSVTLDAMTYGSHSPRPQEESELQLQLQLSASDDSDGQNVALVHFFIMCIYE